MDTTNRRRSDAAAASATASASPPADGPASAIDQWISDCAVHLLLLEPAMPQSEALAIARSMHEFERTAAMAAPVAAEFVASEMRKPDGNRFERRGPATDF